MKKILTVLVAIILIAKVGYSQHFIPVDLIVEARDINVSIYGGLSLDGGSGGDIKKSLSNTGQTGFIVNALYKVNSGRNGSTETFHQFIIDINPIIIDWDPFSLNDLVKQPVDTFSLSKMPFSENSLLHIGWHKNYLGKFYRGGKNQLQNVMFFGEMYYRPYSMYSEDASGNLTNNYRFSVFNVNLGSQYSYIKKDVPVLGNFLIGFSLQMNFMLTNEPAGYPKSVETVMGSNYNGKQYMGPGAKIVVQTNGLNIYVEGRQFYGIDSQYSGNKLTNDPIVLVGAFGNIKWKKYKNKTGKSDNTELE